MYAAYSLLLSLGLLLLSPYFLFQALAHRKYITGLRERLGSLPKLDQQPVVWLHCVSVGETQAARPLVERITSMDDEERMPPLESHKQLKPDEIALLQRWVAEGAPYEERLSIQIMITA